MYLVLCNYITRSLDGSLKSSRESRVHFYIAHVQIIDAWRTHWNSCEIYIWIDKIHLCLGHFLAKSGSCSTSKWGYYYPSSLSPMRSAENDDVIKWEHFPRYLPFVRGIHRLPVNSPHKDQWRAALMLSLICVWINCWVNNREAGDLRRHHGHYDVNVMRYPSSSARKTSTHGSLYFIFLGDNPLSLWA